jgi:ketosteroid isomerase-like protein
MVGFLALNGHMQLEIDRVIRTDKVALLFSSWKLLGTGPEGSSVETSGQTSDVVRKQPNGIWLFVIDNPHGAEAAKAFEG